MPERRRGGVQSLDRALDVLEALGAAGELGVSEVAARTGLVVSTAHRLLAGLTTRGYVAQNPATGRYLLGFKMLELTGGLEVRTSPLRAAARPHLELVQQATSETTNLAILNGDRVIYVDQVEGSHSLRMFTRLGGSALAHATGSGKAILTHRPPEVIAKLFRREPLERLTPRTLTTLEALRDDFVRIRRRGYALDSEEQEEGVSCVATAVFDSTGSACGAISISGPTPRIDQADTRALGRLLQSHAAEISAALGYRESPAGARSGAV